MNKTLLPLAIIFLCLVGYFAIEMQKQNAKQQENRLQELLIQAEINHLNGLTQNLALQAHTNLTKLYHKEHFSPYVSNVFLMVSLQSYEIFGNKKPQDLLIKSNEFIINDQVAQLYAYVDIQEALHGFHNHTEINESIIFLLISILGIFAIISFITLYSKKQQESLRMESELKQQQFEKELDQIKHQKNTQKMKSEIDHKEEQLRRADKMSSLGVLASGIAHEINNPNTYISLNADTIEKAWQDLIPILDKNQLEETTIAGIPYPAMKDRLLQLTKAIKEGSERIQRIVGDLKNFAGNQNASTKLEPVDVSKIMNASKRLTENFIQKHTSNFTTEINVSSKVLANEQKLEQVLINLLINAAQALPDKNGKIHFKATETPQHILLSVKDNGHGISEELQKKVFDPFFTTKADMGGTGLGLSISYGIIQEMGGAIEINSQPQQGSEFIISLQKVDIGKQE